MRRSRQRREFLDKALARKRLDKDRRQQCLVRPETSQPKVQSKKEKKPADTKFVSKRRLRQISHQYKSSENGPSLTPLHLGAFQSWGEYAPSLHRKMVVVHVLDAFGVGGAQVMAAELIKALDLFYPEDVKNHLVFLTDRTFPDIDFQLVESYGLTVITSSRSRFFEVCQQWRADIVIHHRVSMSSCIRRFTPSDTKYLLVNHSYYGQSVLGNLVKFRRCDAFVCVCNFIRNWLSFPEFVHKSRKFTILNSVNGPDHGLQAKTLKGGFITGRCQRLVPSKFKTNSIKWLDAEVLPEIPDHRHYIIGNNAKAKTICEQSRSCRYLGPILDRREKYSYVKAFDVYFYETFQDEGASVSILESLACGVPVLAMPYGGTPELVKDGVNGYLVKSREEFKARLLELSSNRDNLRKLKESTVRDFEERLHPRHMASKYMQVFDALLESK